MIEKLTPEQEAEMPKYVQKWIDIGTNTDRLDYNKTVEIVKDFRELIEMKTDGVPTVLVDNPIEAWVVCCLHEEGVKTDDLISEMKKVFNGNPEKREIPQAELPYQTGSFFAPTFSFYDYFLNCVGIKLEPELDHKYKIWEATKELGCIYPLEGITVVSQKPSEIYLNENNVLHRDGGAALVYAGEGDFKCYVLNGVTVPEYLAVTPAGELDISKYNEETNADVKAEFVRKVGIEQFLDKGKKIDTYKNYDAEENPWWHKSGYELWDMSFMFSTLDYAPYLKMTNPTTKIFHVEGVSPNCRTLKDAIKERFGDKEMRIIASA
jgi:hypothetical protein